MTFFCYINFCPLPYLAFVIDWINASISSLPSCKNYIYIKGSIQQEDNTNIYRHNNKPPKYMKQKLKGKKKETVL